MKRKSGRKSSRKDEENSNGVESRSEQNGDTSDHDEDEAPKDKKRKSSKASRKSVSFSGKKQEAVTESDKSEDQENIDDQKEEKKSSKASRRAGKREEESHSEEDDEDFVQKKKSSKKSRKSAPKEEAKDKGQDSEDQDEDDESQYEVESVLDEKMIKGVRHYLIRWKGYEEESDTWEPEGTLDCDRLIQEFKEKKKKSGGKIKKTVKKERKDIKTADWDENEDFEVDRILEVHHRKDGKREFLVSWKGYSNSDNSWEPEDNMDCKDLIAKFMAKVEKARLVEEKELRVHRPHVQRYTLSTTESGRRLSKRFKGKERVQYHDAE